MLGMNESSSSAQCRELSLSSGGNHKRNSFYATGEKLGCLLLKQLPDALHVGHYTPLIVPREQFEIELPMPVKRYDRNGNLIVEPAILRRVCDGDLSVTQWRKELVIDIDITDFVRFCQCDGMKRFCTTCWAHIEGSYLFLRHFLITVYGYREENILWVFSGCKGVHCLVNSSLALTLSEEQRKTLHSWLHIANGDDKAMDVFIRKLITEGETEFVTQIEEFFENRVVNQCAIIQLEPFVRFALAQIARLSPSFVSLVANAWHSNTVLDDPTCSQSESFLGERGQSLLKWRYLKNLEGDQRSIGSRNNLNALSIKASTFIAFRFLYPMIDAGPMQFKHLAKAPFSVHHTTNMIALPIRGETILDFAPQFHAINLSQLTDNRLSNHATILERFSDAVSLMSHWIDHYNS